MRATVLEAVKGMEVDHTDGVKVTDNGGWAQIIPDPDEPVIHLFADEAGQREALDGWHGIIGKLIIEHWGFSAAQASAAENYLDLERKPHQADLTDVVQIATLLDSMATHPEAEQINLDGLKSARRLSLRHEMANAIIRESNDEIRALADALSA